MPRQNRRRDDSTPPTRALGSSGERREDWRGEQYSVRMVTGSGAVKTYRCPGCDHVVPAGVPHVVAYPAADFGAIDRRHWHTACWSARDRRAPDVRRGRSAPRY